MALLQTAQQEADQVTEATFLTMVVTVKNIHFRHTIPTTHCSHLLPQAMA